MLQLIVNVVSCGADKFDQLTGHLTAGHMNYFSHWDRLIDLEEAEMYRNREEVRAADLLLDSLLCCVAAHLQMHRYG